MEITKGENANLAGMEPRCPKCGSTQIIQVWRLKDGFSVSCYGCGAIFKTPEESHHAQFFRSPAPTPPLDVEAEKRIADIRERESKATKGPWVRWDEHPSVYCENNGLNNPREISGNKICACDPDDLPDDYGDDEDLYAMQAEGNADFIAHARLDIPFLLEQRDFLLEQISLLRRHIASPAQPEKRDALLGKVVSVDNPQFTGFGVAQYDSGERKRVIGVKLENGNTWEYDAKTVRLATPEEIKQAPRVIQESAAPPQSGKEGQ